jgi:hypothetical protein
MGVAICSYELVCLRDSVRNPNLRLSRMGYRGFTKSGFTLY